MLELHSIIDKNMFLQFIGLICIISISLVSTLVQPRVEPAEASKNSVNHPSKKMNPVNQKDLAEIQGTLKELGEKVADLHAMQIIKQKKAGAET